MKVTVSDHCVGCGLCATACPVVFHLENGLSQAGAVPENQEEAVRAAARDCPVGAITVQD